MQKITPFLWFDTKAEEAANLYTTIFPNSKITQVTHYGPDMSMPEGTVLTISFILNGVEFGALNGGPEFKFNESISFVINCKGQEEVDHYWNALTADGGQESQCGWLKDKFGVSWQVVPEELIRTMNGEDKEGAMRATQAMLSMKKIIVADLEKAYKGE